MDEIQLLTAILAEIQDKDVLNQINSSLTDMLNILKFMMAIQVVHFLYDVVMKERRYGNL